MKAIKGKTILRRLPYPYRAMMAICSDLDLTPNKQVYLEIARFLNTHEQTSMGRGVGLEVGNTIYFDMPANQFSYYNTDEQGRDMIHRLIRSGHIDTLHSYGDFATHRSHAQKAIEVLLRNNCYLKVWIDHAVAPTNFGADIMKGHGDDISSEAYHSDLTLQYGIRFIWRGRVTSVTGQNAKRRFKGIFEREHPKESSISLLKETAKVALAKLGNIKYSIHKTNNVLRNITLRDGRKAVEFIRCNPHYAGVSRGDTANGISEVITKKNLDNLISRKGVCILYTHLGKIDNNSRPFNENTIRSFRLLAEYCKKKSILVASTRKALSYLDAVVRLSMTHTTLENGHLFRLTYAGDKEDLGGLTIYTDKPDRAKILVNGFEMDGVRKNPADETGRTSISIPWQPLEFPVLE